MDIFPSIKNFLNTDDIERFLLETKKDKSNLMCNVPSGLLYSRPSVSPEIIYLLNIPNIESHLSSGSQVLHEYYGSGVCYF